MFLKKEGGEDIFDCYFLVALCSLWNLSSLTRGGTWAIAVKL